MTREWRELTLSDGEIVRFECPAETTKFKVSRFKYCLELIKKFQKPAKEGDRNDL